MTYVLLSGAPELNEYDAADGPPQSPRRSLSLDRV